MKPLSAIIQNLPQSGIRVLQELAAGVPDCIRLETGEPNFITPKNICDAAINAMKEGMTKYTPLAAYPSLRKAIAEDYSSQLGIKVEPSEVIVTTGAVMSIFNALLSIADPGDEILIPDPAWPVYEMQCLALGLKPVRYLLEEEHGYQPTEAGLERAITAKTKAILVNSPSNPTGAVFDEPTVRMVMETAKRHDLYVISDEIYNYLVYDGIRHVSLKSFDEDGRVVLVSGASKKYAMTGWRVGLAIANQDIIGLMAQVMIANAGNCCSIAQKAYEAALLGPQDFVEKSMISYQQRRDAVLKICKDAGVPLFIPQGAFYLWLDITRTGMDSGQFTIRLFEKTKVAIAPGTTFGKTGTHKIRISFGTEIDVLCEGVKRICAFINEVRQKSLGNQIIE